MISSVVLRPTFDLGFRILHVASLVYVVGNYMIMPSLSVDVSKMEGLSEYASQILWLYTGLGHLVDNYQILSQVWVRGAHHKTVKARNLGRKIFPSIGQTIYIYVTKEKP